VPAIVSVPRQCWSSPYRSTILRVHTPTQPLFTTLPGHTMHNVSLPGPRLPRFHKFRTRPYPHGWDLYRWRPGHVSTGLYSLLFSPFPHTYSSTAVPWSSLYQYSANTLILYPVLSFILRDHPLLDNAFLSQRYFSRPCAGANPRNRARQCL